MRLSVEDEEAIRRILLFFPLSPARKRVFRNATIYHNPPPPFSPSPSPPSHFLVSPLSPFFFHDRSRERDLRKKKDGRVPFFPRCHFPLGFPFLWPFSLPLSIKEKDYGLVRPLCTSSPLLRVFSNPFEDLAILPPPVSGTGIRWDAMVCLWFFLPPPLHALDFIFFPPPCFFPLPRMSRL